MTAPTMHFCRDRPPGRSVLHPTLRRSFDSLALAQDDADFRFLRIGIDRSAAGVSPRPTGSWDDAQRDGLPGGELAEGQERPPWGAPACAAPGNDLITFNFQLSTVN